MLQQLSKYWPQGARGSLMEQAGFEPGLAEKGRFRGDSSPQLEKLYSVEAPSHHLSTSLPPHQAATCSRKYTRKLNLPFPLLFMGVEGRENKWSAASDGCLLTAQLLTISCMFN